MTSKEMLSDNIQDNSKFKKEILSAIKYEKIRINLLPVYSTDHFDVHHLEANLVLPDHDILSNDLINLAVQYGIIHQLSYYTLNKITELLSDIRKHGINYPVSVSISKQMLNSETFIYSIIKNTRESILNEDDLIMEVSEGILDNSDNSYNMVRLLKRQGFPVSINRLGNGFLPLSVIVNLKPDLLKIDKIIINHIEKEYNYDFILTCIAISNKLGINLVVEGVNKSEQLIWLISEGCEYVQGPLLQRPQYVDYFYSNGFELELRDKKHLLRTNSF